MSLKQRQDWAYHVAKAGLVKCTQRVEGVGMKWTVPSRTNVSGMEFHTVKRIGLNQFKCWLENPLSNGTGSPCKGNRHPNAGVCQHVMAVVTDEMLRQGRRAVFWLSEEDAEKQNRPRFHVNGEAGGVWVSHRKGG